MRKLGLSLALFAGAAAPVAAQQMWQPEIGIRAGFTRFDDPNSSATTDVIDLPMVGGLSATVNQSALYGIIPMGSRMAIQPNFSMYSTILFTQIATMFSGGARLNYAITKDFYVAAGPNIYILKADGNEDTQGALEGAFGYRRAFGNHLRGSAEAFYEKREKSEALPEVNAYGLRLGMGYAFGEGSGSRRAAGRPAMDRAERMWTPSIGIQGGWSLVSFPGGIGDFTTFSLPFTGQQIIATAAQVPTPSTLSLILPVGERIAIEPSVDYHRIKPSSTDALSAYEIGARVNYAFNHVAYAGIGAEYAGISGTGINDGSSIAVLGALGLRFPLVGGLKGRTEINYRTFDGNDAHPAGQMTSFVFGLLVPVK